MIKLKNSRFDMSLKNEVLYPCLPVGMSESQPQGTEEKEEKNEPVFFELAGDERMKPLLQSLLPKKFTWLAWAIDRGGELISHGKVSGDPEQSAAVDRTCNVASVSKVFCAVSVMMLVEQGKLDLDRPVVEYLPEFKTRDPRSDRITLRHCLNHTSGLPGTMWRGFAVNQWADTYYADVLEYFSLCTLKADPGAYSVYCNDGFTLAELVVAKVTGENYGQWCKTHITDPLGMASTRLTNVANPEFPTVIEKNKPVEKMLIGGAAGFTTTMTDLVKFGRVFLADSPLLSRESVAEMAKLQGKTWLKGDDLSVNYGLGWDDVALFDADFDLGSGVCSKGGNSFQFTTTFVVAPDLDLVIAMSHTHDCGFNGTTRQNGMRLAEIALAHKGCNITRGGALPDERVMNAFNGAWLIPGGVFDLHCSSAWCYATWRTDDRPVNGDVPYKWTGERWANGTETETRWLEEADGDTYLIWKNRNHVVPVAQKARDLENEPAGWEARLNRSWIVDSLDVNDLVIHELLPYFTVGKIDDFKGLYQLHFTGLDESGVFAGFEAPIRALDDYHGESPLRTPLNPGRDAMHPRFEAPRDGEKGERCLVGSYGYRSTLDVPVFTPEADVWSDHPRVNRVYRLESKVEKLPEIPEGRRVLALDEKGKLVYDSLYPKSKFEGLKEGWLIFV